MNKKIIGYIALFIVVILAVFLIFRPKDAAQNPAGEEIFLFTRFDCPHCKDVETYIAENKIEEKIKFTKKEIHDADNVALFVDKAKFCGIPEDQMGVPMLWNGKTCFIGADEIINFFNNATTGK